MDTIKQIDIEKIMEEIRADIAAKGYINDVPGFGTTLVAGDMSNAELSSGEFMNEVSVMNRIFAIQAYRPVGSGIKAFIKKVIRKLTKFYIEPIVNDQNEYNAHCVRAFNSLSSVCGSAAGINSLKEQIENQNKVIEALKDQIYIQNRKIEELRVLVNRESSRTDKIDELISQVTDN